MSGSEQLLFYGVRHVKPFRADSTELLVLVVYVIEPLLEVHEMQVHSGDVSQETNCQEISPV